MGFKCDWECNDCGYSIVTSAGKDRGFFVATNTFVCVDCKTVIDGVIGSTLTKMKEMESVEPSCETCGNKKLVVWDVDKKPCPMCGATLKKGGTVMEFWD